MISSNYVDGLELRIRELQKKISDEANASLHLIAENQSLKADRDALAATVEALRVAWEAVKATDWNKPLEEVFAATPQQHLRDVRAEAVYSLNLDAYDAGHLNDFGGGNIGWWQDYMRSALGAAHDFYQSQIDQYAHSIRHEK